MRKSERVCARGGLAWACPSPKHVEHSVYKASTEKRVSVYKASTEKRVSVYKASTEKRVSVSGKLVRKSAFPCLRECTHGLRLHRDSEEGIGKELGREQRAMGWGLGERREGKRSGRMKWC